MAETADVLVVGAGIIGCAIAHEVARRGASVRLFESRSVAAGATHASAGVLAPYIEAPRPGPLLDLTARSLGMYDNFIAEVREGSGVQIEYRRCGTLELAMDEEDQERLLGLTTTTFPSMPEFEWLDAAAVRAIEPSLPESLLGGVLMPSHGYVSVPDLTEALLWGALRHGCEIETGRRVVRISGGDRPTLVTEDGTAWSGAAIVAALGSWTGQLGLNEAAAAAVRPVRGQLLRLAWQGPPLQHVLWGTDCYVVPWTDGTTLVGATVEDVGFDERTTAAGVRDLLDAVCELLPSAWGATFLEARVGLRPATADGLPIVGPSGAVPGLIYATGHFRNGILLAPLTAVLVADLALEKRSDPAVQIMSPERFTEKGTGSLGYLSP